LRTQDNYQYITSLGINCVDRPGDQKAVCPKCSINRRKQNDKSLYINVEKGVWKCYNPGCEWENGSGIPNRNMSQSQRTYTKPEGTALTLSEKVINYFRDERCISPETVRRFNVTAGETYMPQTSKNVMAIHFNYYRNGELVNIKYRDGAKNFKMSAGAELIFYGIDNVKQNDYIIITEGEFDAMSFADAGYDAVSVPNGASVSSQRLEYLENCYDWINGFKKIYIATDNDAPGVALATELARRLGRERCWRINFPEGCKDANDVLIKRDVFELANCYNTATPYPLESVISASDVYADLVTEMENGLTPGVTLSRFPSLSEFHTWRQGMLTVVTGAPGSGKSSWVDNIMVDLAREHGWVFGVWSSEKPNIARHLAELYQIFLDKSFYKTTFDTNRINKIDIDSYKEFFDRHFKFIDTGTANLTIEGLLEKGRQLIGRYGINCLILDNWATIEHSGSAKSNKHEYTGLALAKTTSFCRQNNCDVILVAHPNKGVNHSGKVRKAGGYDVSDSSHFFNLTDNGFTVYRNPETGLTDVTKWKNRWREIGGLGECYFKYNVLTGRFNEAEPVNTGQSQNHFYGQKITREDAERFATS
jgi:twinkle protein